MRLPLLLAEFHRRFPTDDHKWDIVLLEARAAQLRGDFQIPKSNHDLIPALKELLNDELVWLSKSALETSTTVDFLHFSVIKNKKFLHIRVPHVEKPPSTKIRQLFYMKFDFFTRGKKKSNFQKFSNSTDFLCPGLFRYGELESEGIVLS